MTEAPQESDNDELATIRRACAGDGVAFALLVDSYAARIYTHLYRFVRNPQDAEDLTQEVFLKAYRFLRHYDGQRPFRSWLYAIATNTAISSLRGKRPQPPVDWPVAAPSPALSSTADELHEKMAEAVRRLSPQSALLIDLHYREGMTIAEAAHVARMTDGAAKTMLCRARKQLRQWLTEHE